MAVKIDPIAQDIQLLLNDELSPQAKSQAFARFARETIAEVDAANDAALGYDAQFQTFVDGAKSANLEAVKPQGGMIAAEWDIVTDVFAWIAEQLVFMSPKLSGLYEASHAFYADDAPADPDNPPPATTYFFINLQPYARKIEGAGQRPPFSAKAPSGVYQVVAAQAARRFSNIAKISFSYRSPEGAYVGLGGKSGGKTASAEKRLSHEEHNATRQPAVVIMPR